MSGPLAWSPRYILYAQTNGLSPRAQLAFDDLHWPGGRSEGFQTWLKACWAAWLDLRGLPAGAAIGDDEGDNSAFDAWLRSGSYEEDSEGARPRASRAHRRGRPRGQRLP